MELRSVIYFIYFVIILFIFYFLSKSESFEPDSNKRECSRTDINDQLYNYNVNTINKFVRP